MTFNGDKKVGVSLLGKWEKRFIAKTVPLVPAGLETYHLTLSTILWSGFIIIFSYLAQKDIQWMWGTSFMILLQYLTDLWDGPVGRTRGTGLVRWGYYMDHFLDYVFLCSVLIGYSFLFHDRFNTLFFILAVLGAFMVNSFLAFAATNEFRIEHFGIGPTEIRLLFVFINTLIIFAHQEYFVVFLPYVLLFCLFGLMCVTYKTQKELWKKDMEIKEQMKR